MVGGVEVVTTVHEMTYGEGALQDEPGSQFPRYPLISIDVNPVPGTFIPKVYGNHGLHEPLLTRYSKTSEQLIPPEPALFKVAEANSS
jgi:hypothetical protein